MQRIARAVPCLPSHIIYRQNRLDELCCKVVLLWRSVAVLIYAWGETRFSSVQAIGKERGQGIERGKLYSVEYASLHCLGPLARFLNTMYRVQMK